ncbi:unnamed protein product [Camellia sinensis]
MVISFDHFRTIVNTQSQPVHRLIHSPLTAGNITITIMVMDSFSSTRITTPRFRCFDPATSTSSSSPSNSNSVVRRPLWELQALISVRLSPETMVTFSKMFLTCPTTSPTSLIALEAAKREVVELILLMEKLSGMYLWPKSPICRAGVKVRAPPEHLYMQYFVNEDDTVAQQIIVHKNSPGGTHFRRVGPRQKVYFESDEVHASIVTCGGLCPGINTVIREIVCGLYYMYGVNKVLGIEGGYRGFYSRNTIPLAPKVVNDIHKRGGTILGTSRGGHETSKIVDSIQDRGITQGASVIFEGTTIISPPPPYHHHSRHYHYYPPLQPFTSTTIAIVVTTTIIIPPPLPPLFYIHNITLPPSPQLLSLNLHTIAIGATANVAAEIKRRGLKVAVAGITKTIDNDIPVIDKSFGFDTGVEEAQRAINAAHVEAESFENGVGVVKLMGCYSGFIAMYATLASRDVDCCLIPESPFYLEGPGGLFEFMEKRLKENGHMVIVIAEGAGQELLSESMHTMNQQDASENKLLQDVGLWISQKIKDHFNKRKKDPTYMIRAIPSIASDNVNCKLLAQSAIHGAMAGYTGFTVGPVNGKHAYIPFYTGNGRQNKVVITDRMWARLLSSTNQPSFLNPKDIIEAKKEEQPKTQLLDGDSVSDEPTSKENGK